MNELNVDYTRGDEQQDEDYTHQEEDNTLNEEDENNTLNEEDEDNTLNEEDDEWDFKIDADTSYTKAVRLFDLLTLEDSCGNPRFIKWLMDKKAFTVNHVSDSGIILDFSFEYYGYGPSGEKPFRRFETVSGEFNAQDHITAITEIREYYDQWRKEELNKILKNAGIATAIGVSLISLIFGLSLGLKRKGKDLVRESKSNPSHKEIPLTNLEGKGLIIIGDNIYTAIGVLGVGAYLYRKKK